MKNLCKSILALMFVLTFSQCMPPENNSGTSPSDTVVLFEPPVITDTIPLPPVYVEPLPQIEIPAPVTPPVVEQPKPEPVVEVKPPAPVKPAPELTLRSSPITWGVAFKESDLGKQKVIDETYKHFRSVTAENGMKAGKVQKKEGVFDFKDGKALVKIAKAKGLRVHAHACFIWPSQESGLPAFWHEAAKDKARYVALLKNTVQTYVKAFKGDITGIDIINEAYENNGKLRPCYALTHIGENYPEQMAKWVKEIDPSLNVFISDYDFETKSHKATVVIKYAGELKKKGLVDGISSQMHTGLGLNYKDYKSRLDEMAKQNLLVHISELDLRKVLPEDEQKKAKVFQDVAKGFRTLPAPLQYGITVWSHTNGGNFYNYQLKPQKWAPVIFDNNFSGGVTLPAILEVK